MKEAIVAFMRRQNTQIYLWCLAVTLLWRSGLELLNQTIVSVMHAGPGFLGGRLPSGFKAELLRWTYVWDGGWYNGIEQFGYHIQHNANGQESVAFFPLYPLLVKIVSLLAHIPLKASALLLNVVITSVLAYSVYHLAFLMARKRKAEDASKIGRIAVILLLVGPSSFFFAANYADALLALLATASIYLAHRDKYLAASCLAGLASATKSIGIVLLPVLLVMYIVRFNLDWRSLIRKKSLALGAYAFLAASGLIIYMAYLWRQFGNPLLFMQIEKYWGRSSGEFFLLAIWHTWYAKIFSFTYFGSAGNYLYSLLVMAIPLLLIVFVAYILIKHGRDYWWLAIMSLGTLLIPLSTGTLLSLNRYITMLTPVLCYCVAQWYSNSRPTKNIFFLYGYVSALVLIVSALSFLSFRFAG